MEGTRNSIQAEAPGVEDPFAILPGEEWRPVPGYEGIYEVSSLGRVRSLARTATSGGAPYPVPAKILRQASSGNGFRCVHLSWHGRGQTFGVHVLVAMAFIGPRPEGGNCVAHHKDGDRGNNSADNIDWLPMTVCVNQETIQRRRVETRRSKGKWNNSPRPVELVIDGKVVARCGNANQASKVSDLCATTIRDQCRGRKSRRAGYQWRYAETKEED